MAGNPAHNRLIVEGDQDVSGAYSELLTRPQFIWSDRQFPFCVYRLFDDAGRLLYVGATRNFRTRMNQHRRTQYWWPRVSPDHIVVDGFATDADASAFESLLISERQPLFNRVDGHYPIDYMPVSRPRGSRHAEKELAVLRVTAFMRAMLPHNIRYARETGMKWNEIAHALSMSRTQVIELSKRFEPP